MKLRARVERSKDYRGRPQLRLTFPKGQKPFMWESILKRNLGPRPYSEGFYVNKDGESVCFYGK